MVVSVASVRKKLILRSKLALGAIPLVRSTLEKPAHQRMQTPTKQHRRPTVAEIEAQRKNGGLEENKYIYSCLKC